MESQSVNDIVEEPKETLVDSLKRNRPRPFDAVSFTKNYAKKMTGKDDVEFGIIRECSESLDKSYGAEIEFYKNVLHEIYGIVSGENPSDVRTQLLDIIEVALFGDRITNGNDDDEY